ncbi:MAG: hypothetical protein VX424_06200 [Actinomycetota bacterium]|nr:hypothetical protein [Actinomycetota bacterium]
MILTLCISGLAFVLSVISVVWQVVSWRRSGPRIKVKRIHGIGGPPQGVWLIGVQAENSGRLGTQVQQFGFQLPDGQFITALEDFLGMPIQLPMELPAGGVVAARYNALHIRNALAGRRFGKRVRPFVETGHGRYIGKKIDLANEVDILWRQRPQ